MFTGIIETLAKITAIEKQGSNLRITFSSEITSELKVDQSVAHDGVCLTVTGIKEDEYTVDVIQETIDKTALSHWEVRRKVNLERSVTLNQRMDGHIVQGHVDSKMKCISIEDKDGSWFITFDYPKQFAHYLIPKGSICINGVSLTIAELTNETVSVAIIPYTFSHTNFHQLQVGDQVNVEFDVVGKYIYRMAEVNQSQ